MVAKYLLLFLVALGGYASTVNGQEGCIPDTVENLVIHANSTLSWQVSEDEPCAIASFQVDAYGDQGDEYHFTSELTYVDFSFLEICEQWQFIVIPISDEGVIGYERRLTSYIPLPPNADISLSYFNATELGPGDVLLEWDLLNYTHGDCTLRYRITIEDLETGDIQDIYVTGLSVHLDNLVPCGAYHLGVRAVNSAYPTIEGPLRYHDIDIAGQILDAPRLESVDVTASTITSSWSLEDVNRNRCFARTLFVIGGPHFNVTIPVYNRPIVEFTLMNLRPSSMYLIRVGVLNTAGLSDYNPVAIQTLDLDPGM